MIRFTGVFMRGNFTENALFKTVIDFAERVQCDTT